MGLEVCNLPGQFRWVGGFEHGGELGSFLRGEDSGIEDALVRSAGFVIGASLLAMSVRASTDRFRRRPEHLEPHSHQSIEIIQQLQLDGRVVTVVERVSAHDVAVLLLDVGIIVGLIWPRSGEE